jgi:hypothetical protein
MSQALGGLSAAGVLSKRQFLTSDRRAYDILAMTTGRGGVVARMLFIAVASPTGGAGATRCIGVRFDTDRLS